MAELVRLTRDALDGAMRKAGWTTYVAEAGSAVYERPAPAPFALRAQVWIEGAPVELQSSLWLACDAADQALEHLGEGDVNAWVARHPTDDLRIERPDQMEAVVGRMLSLIGATAEQLLPYATVDAFVEALASDSDTSETASIAAPTVLAVAGREREALERARRADGDFADRLERWLAGERPPPPAGSEGHVSWADAFKAARRRAHATSPEERARRPQASWRDVSRTGHTLLRALRGELPPDTRFPDHERAWSDVELGADAAPVLDRAYEQSPLPILPGAFITARLEPAAEPGRLRVLVDEVDIGSVPAPHHSTSAMVTGRLQRPRRGAPLSLAVQLPDA